MGVTCRYILEENTSISDGRHEEHVCSACVCSPWCVSSRFKLPTSVDSFCVAVQTPKPLWTISVSGLVENLPTYQAAAGASSDIARCSVLSRCDLCCDDQREGSVYWPKPAPAFTQRTTSTTIGTCESLVSPDWDGTTRYDSRTYIATSFPAFFTSLLRNNDDLLPLVPTLLHLQNRVSHALEPSTGVLLVLDLPRLDHLRHLCVKTLYVLIV